MIHQEVLQVDKVPSSAKEREKISCLCGACHRIHLHCPLFPPLIFLFYKEKGSDCIATSTTMKLLSEGFGVVANYPHLICLKGCVASVKVNKAPKICHVRL